MGIQHLLLLLIYLDPLNVLCAATANKKKNAPKRNQKMKEVNGTEAPTAVPRRNTQVQAPSIATHDTCLGYYDVSGAYDKVFECNNTEHRYCCGSCFLRYCCAEKGKRIEQKTCTNYNTPDWIKTQPPSPAPTGDTYDPDLDQTNTTVYITCGVIAFIILIGVSAKVAYDKATKPPQEMNVHRALADILRQQGLNKENENIAALEGSPKDMDTPLRTSKNHYTPVHTMLANHGHYGKENFRQGQLDHNFISSGFVTLGRPHLKAQHSVDDLGQLSWQGDLDVPNISYSNHQHDYQHSHLDLTQAHTPKIEKPQRMNNILTSQTEPYDLDMSFSRSFQNLTHLPPNYELAAMSKADLSKYSSLHKLSDKDIDEYYMRKRHQDLAGRQILQPPHMVKLNTEPHQQHRQRPHRVQRAMSQDHVLSPERTPRHGYGLSAYNMGISSYGSRILSEEQLLSADRLQSQDPLLSPDKMLSLRRSNFREKAMSRAMSHVDINFVPTTPVMDRSERYAKMQKMHSHPTTINDSYNTLTVSHPTTNKRQQFASRRTHTVDHLQYIPGHQHNNQYRTASKNEVTV
ncbi:protein shisa-6-like isoform X2 [Salvelinus fontinalis]|uniref:protein shisa-6-like isoform X2 n=1 Tax=Salvelinus fontinalis TaxID=8038 RepID=UPI0024861B96|nr:protein shisa-6-like isoform X2 [Salvelinus fontinalis]